MNKFLSCVFRHTVILSVVSALLLLLCAAGLIFRPDIILLILRYGVAALNILTAVWLIFFLIKRKK